MRTHNLEERINLFFNKKYCYLLSGCELINTYTCVHMQLHNLSIIYNNCIYFIILYPVLHYFI